MRVTNWQRWQRTKGWTAAVIVFIGLGCIGGLEWEVGDPEPPSELGGITCFVVAGWIVWTICKKSEERWF